MSKPGYYDKTRMLEFMQKEVNCLSSRLIELPQSTERLALQYCVGALQTSMYRIQHGSDE